MQPDSIFGKVGFTRILVRKNGSTLAKPVLVLPGAFLCRDFDKRSRFWTELKQEA
jgi:hypothetical protein